MTVLSALVYIFYGYVLAGLIFALWFVFRGVHKVDKGMEGASWKMRLLLLPGSIALWPYLWLKVRAADK